MVYIVVGKCDEWVVTILVTSDEQRALITAKQELSYYDSTVIEKWDADKGVLDETYDKSFR